MGAGPGQFRLYVDTSVFGGVLDDEFAAESRRFFDLAGKGLFKILMSPVVIAELAPAPGEVRAVLESMPPGVMSAVEVTPEAIDLREAYVAAGIVGRRYVDDATHVALATVARADAVVSWNFKHMVRLDKMRGYNRVNIMNGFGIISIVTPREVLFDD